MSHYGAVALYLNAAGKSTEVRELLERLTQVDPGHPMLTKVENAVMIYNMERAQERMAKWEETSRRWRAVCALQQKRRPLFHFLKEQNVSTYSKIPVIQALEQLYYHQPQLQTPVADGLHDVAQHFLEHRADETLADTVVIADIAGMLWELGGNAYKQIIKALYDQDLVYVGTYGTYEELLKWKADPEKERLELRDIYGIYAHITSTWAGYQDDEEDGFEDDDELTEDADWEMAHTPFVRPEPKVGCNDPCPCGSEKKYKKCCGKEQG